MVRVLILQYDNRGDLFPQLTQANRLYAQRMGYDYLFLDKSGVVLPPYWEKVFLVQKYLSDYDFVMWLDTDAVIHGKGPIPGLDSGADMILCPDPPYWPSRFNAGVFVVKNTYAGHSIVHHWLKGYNPRSWIHHKGGWKCHGEWAGYDYEQGYFDKELLDRCRKHLLIHDFRVFQTTTISEIASNTFVVHFAAERKYGIGDYVRRYLERSRI